MATHVELLRSIPMSGSIQERHFDVSGAGNTWALFRDESGSEWVGVFGSGEFAFHAALLLADDAPHTALIIAGGQGFFVEVDTGLLVRRTPWSYSTAAIAIPGTGCAVIADDIAMWTASRDGDRPVLAQAPHAFDPAARVPSRRVALDGIVFDSASASELRGKVWDGDGWYACRVLFPEHEFRREGLVTSDWTRFG